MVMFRGQGRKLYVSYTMNEDLEYERIRFENRVKIQKRDWENQQHVDRFEDKRVP